MSKKLPQRNGRRETRPQYPEAAAPDTGTATFRARASLAQHRISEASPAESALLDDRNRFVLVSRG